MATGDQADVAGRLRSLLPPSWFPQTAPNVNALLQAFASAGAFIYSLIAFAYLQIRLATASGVFLDVFAYDYLGLAIRRRKNEQDDHWRARIKREILRERVTRNGMAQALYDLTGSWPTIVEPWNPGDVGALNIGTLALAGASLGATNGAGVGGMALNTNNHCLYIVPQPSYFSGGAGLVGSTQMPCQALIMVNSLGNQGIPNVAGLGTSYGGLGAGGLELVTPSQVVGAVTTQDVYDTINAAKPTGSVMWVGFPGAVSSLPSGTNGAFDQNFDSNWG